jgi:MFS family permease
MNNLLIFFKRLQRGSILNILVQVASNLGLGFAAFFFRSHGVELYKIVLIWAISPLVSLPIVVLSNNWNLKKYLAYGSLAYTGMALSLLFYNKYSFVLFAIFNGLTLGYFWVSLNYIFFLDSTKEHHAKDFTVYFILGPLLGIILPPLGALVIANQGFKILFLITSLVSLLPLVYIHKENFGGELKHNFKQASQAFAGLKTIAFFNDALHFFQTNFLAVYALLFLKTDFQVSGLLSYLALASLAVSFIVSYASDKYNKRVEFLYPLLIVMSVLMLIIPAIKSVAVLVIVVGFYAILDNLSLPIRFAVPMDLAKIDIGFWRVAEFYGNIGRVVVFSVASLLLYLGSKWLAFLLFAVMTFLLPFIINRRINLARTVDNLSK